MNRYRLPLLSSDRAGPPRSSAERLTRRPVDRPGPRAAVLPILAVGLCVAAGCATQRLPRDERTGIPRFAKVSDALYRGGQPDERGLAELRDMGVRTVVSLRTLDAQRAEVGALGLRYEHISFEPGHPEDEDVIAFLRVVSDPAAHPVFVHCQRGTDRTGMMVAVYRMVIEDWTREAAMAEMEAMGFSPLWNPITEYLEHLDVERLRQRLEESAGPTQDDGP